MRLEMKLDYKGLTFDNERVLTGRRLSSCAIPRAPFRPRSPLPGCSLDPPYGVLTEPTIGAPTA
jgi:hypothetical protein